MQRLLLADRIKGSRDSFLVPLIPALQRYYDVRFISAGPGEELAAAIAESDIVWLEWCWDHAVWATRNALPPGKPCIVRLHSIEALQTPYPGQMEWSKVTALVTVAPDITDVLLTSFPAVQYAVPIHVIPNGIDTARFLPVAPNRFHIAWIGHLEPKKNPMMLMQIAHRLRLLDPRFKIHVAGRFTDLRTARYLRHMQEIMELAESVSFEGEIADMPAWYGDKGVVLSTSMYESFGMAIGEAMASGAFPVVHRFPGAETLWPEECLFASVDAAISLIQAARPGLYRDWVAGHYGLNRQISKVLDLLAEVSARPVGNGMA